LFSDKGDLPLMEIKKPIDIKCALCAYKNAQASSFSVSHIRDVKVLKD
jgi:hypothetical protein